MVIYAFIGQQKYNLKHINVISDPRFMTKLLFCV